MPKGEWNVRDYRASDQKDWLRCRVLAFLDTAYFDDVWTAKPRIPHGVELVADFGGSVVGVCDATVDGEVATLETIAVHPDHRRLGVGHALLQSALAAVAGLGARSLTAWTRDDEAAIAWYEAEGFRRSFRYLHVYASSPHEMELAVEAQLDLKPRLGFFHAWEEHEAALRASFTRVHGCHEFTRSTGGEGREAQPGRTA